MNTHYTPAQRAVLVTAEELARLVRARMRWWQRPSKVTPINFISTARRIVALLAAEGLIDFDEAIDEQGHRA